MKNEIILALAEKLEKESIAPDCADGSPEAQLGNARDDGYRKGLKDAADRMKELVRLLG